MRTPQPVPRLLIVDDSPETTEVLQRNLAAQGFEVQTAGGVREAVQALSARAVDVVVTDLKMPGIGGQDLIRHVRENHADTAVVMITGYPSIENAVQAVKAGAEDFLAKPFTDAELSSSIERALEKLRARRAAARGASLAADRAGLLGESEPMRRAFAAAERAAASEAPVLVVGESGTGKERVARAIHYASARAAAPFIPFNVAGIPPERIEGELFGAEGRGGLLGAAAVGSLFLDGVGELAPPLQARLARVLAEGTAAARVIAATSRDPVALVRRGRFREALLFRLAAVSIELPPLRERGDDVLVLAQHFASRFAAEAGRPAPRFSDPALQVLKTYRWPGNVRELENVVYRLAVLGGEVLDAPDLPALMRFSALRERGLQRTLAEVETEHIRAVLDTVDGNRTRAAEVLGIDRKTLREKMKRFSPS